MPENKSSVYLIERSIYFKIVLRHCTDTFIKNFQMTKTQACLLGGSLILSSLFISQSCTKSTSSDTTLIGNWTKASDFDGNARSEAVAFTVGDFAYITT